MKAVDSVDCLGASGILESLVGNLSEVLPMASIYRTYGTEGARRDTYHDMGRWLKERLQKEDKGGHIVLESIIFLVFGIRRVRRVPLNPQGGARLAIDRR